MAVDIIARGMSGSNKLPDTSLSDKGKVLMVGSNGKWEAATPSGGGGGGGRLYIVFDYDAELSEEYVIVFVNTEMSISDLDDAWESGVPIVVKPMMNGEYYPVETVLTCHDVTGNVYSGYQKHRSSKGFDYIDVVEEDGKLYLNWWANS